MCTLAPGNIILLPLQQGSSKSVPRSQMLSVLRKRACFLPQMWPLGAVFKWIVDMDDGGLQVVAECCRCYETWFCVLAVLFLVFSIFLFLFWRVGLVGRGTGCCRGLDYPGVTAVIQVGAPDSRHEYVHRVGRTGRAAAEGGPCSLHRRWNMLLSGANDDEMILNRMLPISWQVQHLNHTSPCKYDRIQEELSLQ